MQSKTRPVPGDRSLQDNSAVPGQHQDSQSQDLVRPLWDDVSQEAASFGVLPGPNWDTGIIKFPAMTCVELPAGAK